MTQEHVILVDENDQQIGIEEKLKAHRQGLLHRAFSVFIFRHKGNDLELLLQQRQHDKYHCGGLWTNTCCSHPRPNETVLVAAKRRLQEEMGFAQELTHIGKFQYIAEFANGLTENELDHVLVGTMEEANEIKINKKEVADHRWQQVTELQQQLMSKQHDYTPWLKSALALAISK